MTIFFLIMLGLLGIVLGIEFGAIDVMWAGIGALVITGLIGIWARSVHIHAKRVQAAYEAMGTEDSHAINLAARLSVCQPGAPHYQALKHDYWLASWKSAKTRVDFWEQYGRDYDSWNWQACLKAAFTDLAEAERELRKATPPPAKCPSLASKDRHPHAN